MSRAQWIAIAVALLNVGVCLLFPPFDYVALDRGNIPTFDGFHYAFSALANRRLNGDFLTLEIIVVAINAAIAWLLLRPRAVPARKSLGGNRNQRIVLALVALNLVLMLLFPPFENFVAITKAALPTFEGFYFLFGDNSARQIVSAILYIEIALVLINGGLLWLLFRDKTAAEISADQMREMAKRLQTVQKR